MSAEEPITRAEACATIGTVIGIPGIARFIQFGRERATARIAVEFTDGSTIHLGVADTLFSQAEFAKAMVLGRGITTTRMGTNDWHLVIGRIFATCMDVEDDPDSGIMGRTREWLHSYCALAVEKADEVLDAREPFTHEGSTYVFADSLRRHVKVVLVETITADEVRAALRLIGCERKQFAYRAAHHPLGTSTTYYRVPNDATGD